MRTLPLGNLGNILPADSVKEMQSFTASAL